MTAPVLRHRVPEGPSSTALFLEITASAIKDRAAAPRRHNTTSTSWLGRCPGFPVDSGRSISARNCRGHRASPLGKNRSADLYLLMDGSFGITAAVHPPKARPNARDARRTVIWHGFQDGKQVSLEPLVRAVSGSSITEAIDNARFAKAH